MPTQADAESALVELASAALYPDGTSAAPAIAATVRIYRSWPNAAALDTDLAAGRVNITVFPVPGATRDTTRYSPASLPQQVTPALTVTVTATTASFAGDAASGQLAGLLVDGKTYVHRTLAGDTPATVATALAGAVNVSIPAMASGATITIPSAASLAARTAADATISQELRRQQQAFRITAWCPTPDLRDAACARIDEAFGAIPFLTLADGSAARLKFASTTTFDQRQDAALYRRDLLYSVEYPVTQSTRQPSMLFGSLGLGASVIIA